MRVSIVVISAELTSHFLRRFANQNVFRLALLRSYLLNFAFESVAVVQSDSIGGRALHRLNLIPIQSNIAGHIVRLHVQQTVFETLYFPGEVVAVVHDDHVFSLGLHGEKSALQPAPAEGSGIPGKTEEVLFHVCLLQIAAARVRKRSQQIIWSLGLHATGLEVETQYQTRGVYLLIWAFARVVFMFIVRVELGVFPRWENATRVQCGRAPLFKFTLVKRLGAYVGSRMVGVDRNSMFQR